METCEEKQNSLIISANIESTESTNAIFKPLSNSKGPPFYCYIIANGNSTYNGYTNNLERRLRQHNGIIKGGAKITTKLINKDQSKWHYIAIITNPNWTATNAMQVEWTCKYPTRKKPRPREFQGIVGRIKSLKYILEYIVTKYTDIDIELCKNTSVYINSEFRDSIDVINLLKNANANYFNFQIFE